MAPLFGDDFLNSVADAVSSSASDAVASVSSSVGGFISGSVGKLVGQGPKPTGNLTAAEIEAGHTGGSVPVIKSSFQNELHSIEAHPLVILGIGVALFFVLKGKR